MEYENDANSLEARMAQIDEWKKCKDDAEYRAKVKAENEYWDALNNLRQYHKRIEDIVTLANRLYSYKIYAPSLGRCGLVDLHPNFSQGYREYFGLTVYDCYGANIDHYILYDNGEFYYCGKNHGGIFDPSERTKPETEYLREIYNKFPEFEKKFYEWFDKTLKI